MVSGVNAIPQTSQRQKGIESMKEDLSSLLWIGLIIQGGQAQYQGLNRTLHLMNRLEIVPHVLRGQRSN